MSEMETLRCKAGHNFKRARKPGKKPQWCPEHKPVQQTGERIPEQREGALARARAAKQEKHQEDQSKIDRQVEEILASSVDGELKRKLRYAHDHAAGNSLMTQVRADLIRQATKTRSAF